MAPLLSTLTSRLTLSAALGQSSLARAAPTAAFHLAALAVMVWSEIGAVPMAAFILAWGLINCFWLALLRRPGLAAALSFLLLVILVAISRFKFQVLWMTVTFIDVMIIDSDTFTFLWAVFPKLRTLAIVVLATAVPLGILIWRADPLRVRRRTAMAGGAACLVALAGLEFAFPFLEGESFGDDNYVSSFARSGVGAVSEFTTHGFLESDAAVNNQLELATGDSCQPAARPPHIILVHDESSFDIRAIDGIKVPEHYGGYFRSFDGKARKFLVEGAGGPSWFAEYNVLAGLSVRSYGRFQFFVTRIAAGRVERGLPRALQRCGYRTFANYPVYGGFLSAGSFYRGVGIQNFVDGKDIGGGVFEPDRFYFDVASRMIGREHGRAPMFLYVYLTANHFTWDYPLRAEFTPRGWRSPGNKVPEVNEFLRRQAMSERDYADFLARLERDFPGEPFLIVRYGDHQPDFAKRLIDPTIDFVELGRRLMSYDPRYYMTYYAIDTINFQPRNLASALDLLDAPYLPLVVQEAAGLPLDPSFAEQKRILERCKGLFYSCVGGAEARRFNRLLIDAGLIKGL